MVVRMHDGSGQSELWRSPTMPVGLVDGYFSVVLSDGTEPGGAPESIADVFAANPETCLTVEVGGNEVLPCRPIGSVPYALEASHLGGRGEDGYIWNQTSEPYVRQMGGMSIAGSGYFGGKVAIGATASTSQLRVYGHQGPDSNGMANIALDSATNYPGR